MVELELSEAAESMGQRVNGSEAFLKREASLEGGHHHLPPRLNVTPVFDSSFQEPHRAGEPIERDCLGRGIVARG